MSEEVPIYQISLDQVSEVMNQLTVNMDEQRRFRSDMQGYFQQNTKIDRARNDQLAKTSKLWRGIKSEISTSYNLMLKMSRMGVGIGATGLGLGVAGMYGFNRMSADVGNERRQAQGLGGGTTIGQMKAFDVNMKKILADPLSILASFQKIRETPSESWKARSLLERAGIGSEEASEMTSSDLLIKTLPVQKKIIDDLFAKYKAKKQEIPLNQTGFLSSEGLGMYEGNLDPLRVLHAINEREIPEAVANYTANKGSMNVVDAQAEELQRFNRQWEESVTEISTTFKRTLAPLAPELGALTKEIASTIKSVVDSGDAHKAVTATLGMVDKSVKYLASGEAQTEIQLFWENLKDLNSNIHNLLHPLDYLDKEFFNNGVYNPSTSVLPENLTNKLQREAILDVETSGRNPAAVSNTGAMGVYQVTIGNMRKAYPELAGELPFLKDKNQATAEEKARISKFAVAHQKEIEAVGSKLIEEARQYGKGDIGEMYKIYNVGLGAYQKGNISQEAINGAKKARQYYEKRAKESIQEQPIADPRKGFFMGIKDIGTQIYDAVPHSADELIENSVKKAQSIGQGIRTKWDYLIGEDAITKQQEEAKKTYMEQYKPKPESTSQTTLGGLSYNIPAKDVKRIELGVKIGSRPGSDIFGQAVFLS